MPIDGEDIMELFLASKSKIKENGFLIHAYKDYTLADNNV
jgi:hypothetical protein